MNRLLGCLLLFAFTVVVAVSAEDTNTLPTTITVDGIIYSKVTWRTATSASVTIFHQTGVASIPLEKLPPELQRRFGYDPQKAATYRAQELAAAQRHMLEIQAQERLREQHEVEVLTTARKQQQVQEERAREQLRANQLANADNVEVIQLFHVDGGINPLPTGGYVAQLALTNHTTVCAHFDEDGRRYLEDASRKYAEWNAQQDSLEQQLQVQIQPGTIILSGEGWHTSAWRWWWSGLHNGWFAAASSHGFATGFHCVCGSRGKLHLLLSERQPRSRANGEYQAVFVAVMTREALPGWKDRDEDGNRHRSSCGGVAP